MTPQVAAMRIAPDLLEGEKELDNLLARFGTLVGKMTSARIEMDMSAKDSQRSIARLLEAMNHLGNARSALTIAHADMVKWYYEELGTPVTADFPTSCPTGCLPAAVADAAAA